MAYDPQKLKNTQAALQLALNGKIPQPMADHAQIADDKLASTLFKGVIIDSIHFAHHYWVSMDKGGTIAATDLPQTTLGHMGYRQHNMYPPGTRVLCYRDPFGNKAWIIGALNQEAISNEQHFADWIVQGDRCGWKDEWHHHYQFTLKKGGMIKNLTNSRPADIFPGEWGVMNSLGIGMHLGFTSAMLRTSELAGLYLYYLDNLVRLSAYKYQLWTAAREEESMTDEGENNDILRISPYPWEMLGGKQHSDSEITREPDTGGWKEGKDTNYYEPKADDQTGLFRFHQFRGYLGDGERTLISCPPKGFKSPETLSGDTKHIGLSEIVRMANGIVGLRSVKGIFLEKVCQIVVPKQTKLPDDPEGDSQDAGNYKFAGEVGGGPAHNKHEFEWGDERPTFRSSQLYDMHSWMFNNYSWVSFGRHKKDWNIWEETSPPEGIPDAHCDKAIFSGLGKKFQTSLPNLTTVQIDNRPGHAHKIYKSRSMIAMNDDGSLVIEDGYGSQIIMAGGNIFFTAQGDIFNQPGRNFTVWAPHDAIIRAGNCADITAAKRDVRIKAERNLQVMAGNEGSVGGILFEARGKGFAQDYSKSGTDVVSTGIAFVARDSQIMQYGQRIYTRAIKEGEIIFDADQGKGFIFNFANAEIHTLKQHTAFMYGVRPSEELHSAKVFHCDSRNVIFSQTSSLITEAEMIAGPNASMIIKGHFLCHDLNQDNGNPMVNPKWHPRTHKDLAKVKTDVQKIEVDETQGVREISKLLYKDKTRIGNETFIKQLGFSCRKDEQYGLEGFVIFESKWQHMYAKFGTPKFWDEPIVISPNGDLTRPHPGHETWTSKKYGKVSFKYWEDTGKNAARDFDETSPKGEKPTMTRLDQGYVINIQEA
jgi:hypothetical protein